MSSHRLDAHRGTRRRTSGRTRALVALAAVGVLATGLSVKGTFAFWTDSATLRTGDFNAGNLDITLDGQLAGTGVPNTPGSSFTKDSFTLPAMLPGESIAYSFPVRNNGSTPLTYTLSGTGSGGLAVTNGMQYSVTVATTAAAAAATNTGSQAASNRAGACGTAPGTPSTDTNTTLLTSTPNALGTTANRPLAVGAVDQVCIVARLNSSAGNALQNLVGNASFLFDAKQVGAP